MDANSNVELTTQVPWSVAVMAKEKKRGVKVVEQAKMEYQATGSGFLHISSGAFQEAPWLSRPRRPPEGVSDVQNVSERAGIYLHAAKLGQKA